MPGASRASGPSSARPSSRPSPTSTPAPKTLGDLEPTTEESKALAKELKRRGFVFVGPTSVYATMQAAGVVNDHLAGCAFRDPGG
jgi:DNA-3-methyladenine glycosylase I